MSALAIAERELQMRVLDSLAAIDAAADAWRDLEARCNDELTFFQTLSWCRSWVAEFASDGRIEPHIRTAWRGDKLVAIWPLMRTSGPLGVQMLETLGDPHSQYTNMLCDPADDCCAASNILMKGLADAGRCDVAVLKAVPRSSQLGQALATRHRADADFNEAAILDLSRFESSEAYTKSLRKLQKRNRNRRRNHLARHGELTFEVLWPSDAGYAERLSTCMAMKRRWLMETGRYSAGFALDGYEAFLAQLDGDASTCTGACLSVLSCGGRAVAVELGFILNRHYYAYIGGFDWDLRSHSPGKVQMDMTVCWLIDNGIAAYDLLGNVADYKQSWTNRTVALSAHTIPMSWRGQLFASVWLNGLRPLAKRLYTRIPEAWRRVVFVGQRLSALVLFI